MTEREKLIKLIEAYLKNQISTQSFAENYELIWRDLYEEDRRCEEEEKELDELGAILSRYSPFEADLIEYDSVYFAEDHIYSRAQKAYVIINKKIELKE